MAQISAVSQVFRGEPVQTMGRSPELASTVSGGVLRSTIRTMPGATSWVTAVTLMAGSTTGSSTISIMGSLSVVSGINLFDYL